MTDAMFDLPSEENVTELVISLSYAQEKFEKSAVKQLKVA
jgi:ATP-dependent Clp protease ATP-binding subunit ClpX